MSNYMHPGVYIEHVPSGLLAIEAASTSVAVFIGPIRRGPVGEPVYITNGDQFAAQFGDLDGQAGGIRNRGQSADFFGHAVQAFFANGGTKAYIVRVAEDNSGNLSAAETAIPNPEDATAGFTVTAVNPGLWGDAMVVRLFPTDSVLPPDLELGYTFEIGIVDDGDFVALESFTGAQMSGASPQSIEGVVNDGSTLVNIAAGPLSGTGAIGPVQSVGIRSGPLQIAASGQAEVGGRAVDISVGGNTVTVGFAVNTADIGAIAQQIQDQVRAELAGVPDFTARVEIDGAESHLVLRSGLLGTSGDVTAAAPASNSALTILGLGAAATSSAMPPQDITGGGLIEAYLNGGGDGEPAPGLALYQSVYTTLRDYRDISIMLLPGLNWIEAGDNSIIQSAITHAEFMQNRMLIVDPPDTAVIANRLTTPKDVKHLGVSTSPYVALYYPWLDVANPYYDADTAANLPKTFSIPPSSFAGGLWARIDGTRGVWKAPAGLEATVRSTVGPNVLIGNALQDNLNEFGVNCLRAIIGPTVIWGARTRATKTKPEYRYVPVRRTQNMIGESLYNALQAVVFEPNDHKLWSSLRANVGAFMDTLHRAGAFQGEKASDAYYVKCGLGSTMTQADIDAGVVRVVVGFAALKPAEFVVVQIKQIVGQAR
ncbi:phage tail sheath subtilisin-like domain-containing protein [Halomonas sp. TRM85114]|uniref:phage tail sheath C-terminal domain-containing protein n=1 Tax=Halomonas jincaotanensis TaxID=2810616 RepID=UPI001BD29494|nr:phage tail sheath C-terminal domain-containing protein [Halomonas jincaotanensis]MBS9405392.1 phage tail sheath subtilisin-like domain-containing protein [Halomonas jincaotanensis]